jgi:hypothetical protein
MATMGLGQRRKVMKATDRSHDLPEVEGRGTPFSAGGLEEMAGVLEELANELKALAGEMREGEIAAITVDHYKMSARGVDRLTQFVASAKASLASKKGGVADRIARANLAELRTKKP